MPKNLTSGTPAKLIFFFALPLLIGNLFQQIYNIADTFIVGRTIGVNALAAVGSTGSVMFLMIGFTQAMTAGFSIVTAQAYGARHPAEVRKSFCTSIILSVLAGVILTALGLIFIRDILSLIRTPLEIFEDAHSFLWTIYVGIGAFVAYNLLANSILALGDSKTPLMFLMFASVLNIILVFVFILVFHWGVAGAARATIISQTSSVILCILYIRRKQPALQLRWKDWQRVSLKDLVRSAKIGFPMGFQASIISLGIIIVQWALNSLGPLAVASFTVAQKVDTVAILPMISFGLAMATYTGQNYGAGDIERIRKGVRQCSAMSLSFSVVVGFCIIRFGHYLTAMFVGPEQTEVIANSQIYLNINGSMYWVLALLFIFRFTLQGLGKSLVPTVAGIMELSMRSVAAFVLLGKLGFTGVCMASPLAWLGSCIPLGIAYTLTMRKLLRNKQV